jgi:hypothetical protein
MRPIQPSVVAHRHPVMLSAVPSSGRVNTMIRITGIGDRDRLERLIRINGIRRDHRGTERVRVFFERQCCLLAWCSKQRRPP